MQKMLKTGFRGERKRILTPSLSQGEGECGDGKSEGKVKVKSECMTVIITHYRPYLINF